MTVPSNPVMYFSCHFRLGCTVLLGDTVDGDPDDDQGLLQKMNHLSTQVTSFSPGIAYLLTVTFIILIYVLYKLAGYPLRGNHQCVRFLLNIANDFVIIIISLGKILLSYCKHITHACTHARTHACTHTCTHTPTHHRLHSGVVVRWVGAPNHDEVKPSKHFTLMGGG